MLPGPVIVNSGGQPPSSGLAPSAAVYIAAPGQIGPGSIVGKKIWPQRWVTAQQSQIFSQAHQLVYSFDHLPLQGHLCYDG